MPEWMLGPFAVYALVGISLLLSLFLFVTVKLELGSLAGRARRDRETFQAATGAARAEASGLRDELAGLRSALRELEQASSALVPPPPAPSGLNLTARSQVLRRHRLGEEPAAIAASLGIPFTEVRLLIKVNRLMLENL